MDSLSCTFQRSDCRIHRLSYRSALLFSRSLVVVALLEFWGSTRSNVRVWPNEVVDARHSLEQQ